MEATILTPEAPNASQLRDRISQLRRQIQAVNLEYRVAKEQRQFGQVSVLLRKRSELTRLLFQTQSELLQSFRAMTGSKPDVAPLPSRAEPVLYSE
jgi:hypothetical protein